MSEEREADLEEAADDDAAVEDEVDEEPTDDSATDAADAADGLDEETEDSAEDDESTDEADTEGVQPGDFVKLDYTAREVEEGNLVDTTDQEVADEEGVGDRGEFAPRTVVLGEGHLFGTVEMDIIGKDVGDGGSVTVPADEAFGEHDPDDVQTVSAEKIPEDDRHPGAYVSIDGREGYVETIIGGRARVDFNHPLAGRDVEYEYEILDVVEDRVERAKGLFSAVLDQELEMWIQTDEVEEEVLVEEDDEGGEDADDEEDEDADDDAADDKPVYETQTVEKETLYVEATPQLAMNQQWMFGKQQIAQDVITKLDLDRVIVQEVIEGPSGMGIPGMGGMGGLGGGDIEAALEDVEVDADELVEELADE